MKNKKLIIVSSIIVVTLALLSLYYIYKYIRIKTAKVEVVLIDNLDIEFNDKKRVSYFISSINGKIVDDYIINSTDQLGLKDITFEFINDDGIKLKYTFQVKIIDSEPPLVSLGNTYSVKKNSSDTLIDDIFCGDKVDSDPKCSIIGNYDLTTVGNYPLIFSAIDSSGNKTVKKFTLKVYEPSTNNNSKNNKDNYILYTDVMKNYKKNSNKIGLDISKWQKEVDFEKLKKAGVEFVMIRVGYSNNSSGEMILDPYFIKNIEGAKKVGIDVGVYYYSYASNKTRARHEANWVIEQIKKYDIELPVVFDWEDFPNFNKYNLSFFQLSEIAKAFLTTVENNGYKVMLYSSKNYLENIWMLDNFDIWLAHYTKNTNYQGKYLMWQMCNNGRVDGINTDVDINIMYE